jgi:hypothetical protein
MLHWGDTTRPYQTSIENPGSKIANRLARPYNLSPVIHIRWDNILLAVIASKPFIGKGGNLILLD